ncbi:hypothetical protein K6U65_11645 [Vibrio vulnificus]|nr:hypothetical protein [Vibrio vulnificus]MCG6296124.1 hypothetical protein [Vibrio vulnificus]
MIKVVCGEWVYEALTP